MPVQEILSCPAALVGPVQNISFLNPPPPTISIHLSPSSSKLSRPSCWLACLLVCVSDSNSGKLNLLIKKEQKRDPENVVKKRRIIKVENHGGAINVKLFSTDKFRWKIRRVPCRRASQETCSLFGCQETAVWGSAQNYICISFPLRP